MHPQIPPTARPPSLEQATGAPAPRSSPRAIGARPAAPAHCLYHRERSQYAVGRSWASTEMGASGLDEPAGCSVLCKCPPFLKVLDDIRLYGGVPRATRFPLSCWKAPAYAGLESALLTGESDGRSTMLRRDRNP